MTNSVIKCALRGVDKEILIENLSAMNPAEWLMERLIDGVHVPTSKEFALSFTSLLRNIVIEHMSDFDKYNLYITYDYVETAYATTPIKGIIEIENYKKFDISPCKDNRHTYEVKYWRHTYGYFESEMFGGK